MITLALREEVSVEGRDPLVLAWPGRRLTVEARLAHLPEALRGATEDQVAATCAAGDRALLYHALERLSDGGALIHTLHGPDGPLAVRVPMGPGPGPRERRRQHARLSRYALLRQEGGRAILESPRTAAYLVLPGWRGAAMAALLAEGCAPARLEEFGPADGFLALLESCGALEDQSVPETWAFHDLLFHARSRLGRHDRPYGATWRFEHHLPPALKPPEAEGIPLEPAEPWALLEGRRSERRHGDPPLSRAALGRFLYRSARVVRTSRIPQTDLAHRPYPGGGGMYELELYLTVHRCQDLPPGLYRYDPAAHALRPRPAAEADRRALLRDAQGATAMEDPPQVLITVAARFARMSAKYESMAYATILKDVGVLYQTMYLVATEMGLAACAVGGGDSERFARAAALDPYEEGSVGEFLLGARPDC